jgi:beta-aspartyl-peptidase (threonine type)
MPTNRSLLASLLSLLLPLGLAGAGPGRDKEPTAADPARQAILRVLDAQRSAWNKGDLPGFMSGYWQSERLSFFTGATRTAGWQATLERYRKRYQGEGRAMGQLTFSEIDVEMLGPDSALVRGRWQLRLPGEMPGGLFTLVFRRLPEGWRIIHDHTSN